MPRIEIERFFRELDRKEDRSESSTESFDRIAFAERALELVRPPNTRVAIRQGARRVEVVSGRQWGESPEARWAILAVPLDASRRAIASAVLELHGTAQTRAWALDVLMTELGRPVLPTRVFGGIH